MAIPFVFTYLANPDIVNREIFPLFYIHPIFPHPQWINLRLDDFFPF